MESTSHPALRILHLSDTHLFGDGSKHYGVVDTVDHLRRALSHVEDQSFDLVVCSGDVSEDGSEASYEIARDTIVPWAAERGARAIFAMGNHDNRAAFRAVLGDGQPGADAESVWLENDGDGIDDSGTDPGPIAPAPITSAVTVNGWRTIVLDTTVPGAGYGTLGTDQLDFLSAVLAEPAGHGTVIVMHHPPVDAQTDLLQALALDEASAAELWKRVFGVGGNNPNGNRSDVRAILAGHYHHPVVETVGGIPVVVAPGVANVAQAFGPPAEESSSDSFGGAVVEVSARRVRVVPCIEPVSGDEVFHFSAAEVQHIIAAAGRPGKS